MVRRIVNKSTGTELAAKICNKKEFVVDDRECMLAEVRILRQLRHPNVVGLVDFLEEGDSYYMIMEYLPKGDLFQKVISSKHFDERDARNCFQAVLKGVVHMQHMGITHRDLKPENLLVAGDSFSDIQISDFGFSSTEKHMTSRLRSPHYVAPEVLLGHEYTNAVDMWSVGVLLYFILSGSLPFSHKNR